MYANTGECIDRLSDSVRRRNRCNGTISKNLYAIGGPVSKSKHKKEESKSYTFPLSHDGLRQGVFPLVLGLSINLFLVTLTHSEVSLIEFPRTGLVGVDRLHKAYVAHGAVAHVTLVTSFS